MTSGAFSVAKVAFKKEIGAMISEIVNYRAATMAAEGFSSKIDFLNRVVNELEYIQELINVTGMLVSGKSSFEAEEAISVGRNIMFNNFEDKLLLHAVKGYDFSEGLVDRLMTRGAEDYES